MSIGLEKLLRNKNELLGLIYLLIWLASPYAKHLIANIYGFCAASFCNKALFKGVYINIMLTGDPMADNARKLTTHDSRNNWC